jgi:processive 1,2-diacylglycerol beta-glucosyltransferase
MTVRRKKILILYASYGDGHIQVSRALQEQFENADSCEAMLIDLFAEAYPLLNALTKYIYIKSYTLFPKLYGWSYYSTREMRNDTLFTTWFHSWGMSKLREIIQREQPDAVVNTFPMLAMPELRKKTGISMPIFNVMTDFVLHWRWLHPFVDKYYVATDDLKTQLVRTGLPEHRIEAAGIPLKRSFQLLDRTPALYEQYGLDPGKQTLLVMAGSYGVLQGLREMCGTLAALPGIQLIVVCGKNETLYATMRETAASSPNIRLFGFVKEMNELMSISDTMVTKPGGITLTESIQCGLPVVLFRPVPGQERDNAEYLASKGAAFIANDDDTLMRRIRGLLEHNGIRAEAVRSIAGLRKSASAETIAQDILETMHRFQIEGAASMERRRVSSERIS